MRFAVAEVIKTFFSVGVNKLVRFKLVNMSALAWQTFRVSVVGKIRHVVIQNVSKTFR
jgi:hypothetical protein